MRTPEQIIGHDALVQLAFEGYEVVQADLESKKANALKLLIDEYELCADDADERLLLQFITALFQPTNKKSPATVSGAGQVAGYQIKEV